MSVRLEPIEDSFESMSRQLGDVMHEMTRRSYYHFSRSVAWQPAVNVYHDEKNFYICAELAGLDKKQIHVDVLGTKIAIKGDRAAPFPQHSEGASSTLRMEISYGPFERIIELPEQADMQCFSASDRRVPVGHDREASINSKAELFS
jgi:HSP20 family molecular chaperone IbpA